MNATAQDTIANPEDHAPPPLWGYEQTSRYTGIPLGTLRYMRSVGEGPRSFKIGRAVKYDPRDVIAYVEAQRAQGVGGVETEGAA
ncbi:helix-turn-helix transcriptional regulator [Nesterenkonia xinjiangensis]|uniref:Helix-turn-helix domain-containing protein n=1 Tax=Nesterenkonia xinjiangensis TaxID=225327 RepID=A0A7Z0GLK2_9MICC|nr:DNA-binding protein [Nesterenkonia xinjiangensis]NYJ78257.1 hypothetical protein [Nesterenkonia xinjiangensis]